MPPLFGTIVQSGGTEEIIADATASGTTVSSGGALEVLDGGTAVNPFIASGGTMLVAGTLLIDGEDFIAVSKGIVFSAGAQLELDSAGLSGTLNVGSGVALAAVGGTNILAATAVNSISNSGTIGVDDGATLVLSGSIRKSARLPSARQ